MPQRVRAEWLLTAGIGLAASFLALGIQWAGWLEFYEYKSMDLLMRWRGAAPADSRVVICDIDAESVDRLGQWPWPRRTLADLVDRLSAAGARVIAFDVVFAEPDRGGPEQDAALAGAFSRAGNVILGYYFRREAPSGNGPAAFGGSEHNILDSAVEQVIEPAGGFPIDEPATAETNLDMLAAAADSHGFFSMDPDADGVLRHYAVVRPYNGTYFPALAVRAVQRMLDAGPLQLAPYAGNLPELTLGGKRIPTDEAGRLWINYRGAAGTFRAVSAIDVLRGRMGPDGLRDAIVFVGASETGIADVKAVPTARAMPGVEIHATVADNLLNGRFIHDSALHLAVSLLAVVILCPVVAVLVHGFQRSLVGFSVAGLLVLSWLGVCWLVFTQLDIHLQVVTPFLGGVAAYIGASVYQGVFVEARAREIKHTFQQYVSSAVVEELLKDPERVRLGGERRDLTVFFADVRGFTSMAEKLEPEQVVRLLNQVLTPLTEILLREGGTLDKYMGDAIMAIFGAPGRQEDHAARGCRVALAMRDELASLNRADHFATLLGEAGSHVSIGIGLNSGWMAVGNMGSERQKNYTVVGDAVNLGARLESLNRLYGTDIIVSEFTAGKAGDGFLFRELDRVRVKGKTEPVSVLELMGPAPGESRTRAIIEVFARGQAAYRKRDFAHAEGLFRELLTFSSGDGPAGIYLERCRRFRESPPPPDWDAVETLTRK